MRDMKNKFYRSLQLPKEEAEILRWYRKNIRSIFNNADKRVEMKEKDK